MGDCLETSVTGCRGGLGVFSASLGEGSLGFLRRFRLRGCSQQQVAVGTLGEVGIVERSIVVARSARGGSCATRVAVGLVCHDRILAHQIGVDLLRRKDEGVGMLRRTGDEVSTVLRIEHTQFIDRYIEDVRNLIEVDTVGNRDGVGDNRLCGQHG